MVLSAELFQKVAADDEEAAGLQQGGRHARGLPRWILGITTLGSKWWCAFNMHGFACNSQWGLLDSFLACWVCSE